MTTATVTIILTQETSTWDATKVFFRAALDDGTYNRTVDSEDFDVTDTSALSRQRKNLLQEVSNLLEPRITA